MPETKPVEFHPEDLRRLLNFLWSQNAQTVGWTHDVKKVGKTMLTTVTTLYEWTPSEGSSSTDTPDTNTPK